MATADDDTRTQLDREAILARRRRFVAATLTGLTTSTLATACPCLKVAFPDDSTTSNEATGGTTSESTSADTGGGTSTDAGGGMSIVAGEGTSTDTGGGTSTDTGGGTSAVPARVIRVTSSHACRVI